MKKKLIKKLPGICNQILKVIAALLFIFPFYWMLITSFKPYVETIASPPTMWPHTWTLEGFQTVIKQTKVFNYISNTLIVTISIIVIQILVMVPAAYAFAKGKFPGKNILFGMVLIAQMIPVQLTFITVYLQMADWKLLSTLLPQILPFGANAFGIFLMRQNFMQISDEILEAAAMDKAGKIKIMFQIMLPMAKPSLVTVILFSFISHWNNYFWPLVMTDDASLRPIAVAIAQLKDVELNINWSTIMAGNVIMCAPLLIVFLLANKKIIKAFSYRGVK